MTGMALASISATGYLPNSSKICLKRSSSRGLMNFTRCMKSEGGCSQKPQGFCVTSSKGSEVGEVKLERRKVLMFSTIGLLLEATRHPVEDGEAIASEYADMPALRGKDYGKTKMRYPDYTETNSGLQYKDLRVGSGPIPKNGETVVVDWDGYTIGYYGRIFEARNKTKGGSFEGDDKDFFKFTLGYQQVIPAFEEAVQGMALGGIRRNAGL